MVDFTDDVSAVDMLTTIGRARLAAGEPAESILIEIRQLQPHEIVFEFHRAVASLNARGILNQREQFVLGEYARDYLRA